MYLDWTAHIGSERRFLTFYRAANVVCVFRLGFPWHPNRLIFIMHQSWNSTNRPKFHSFLSISPETLFRRVWMFNHILSLLKTKSFVVISFLALVSQIEFRFSCCQMSTHHHGPTEVMHLGRAAHLGFERGVLTFLELQTLSVCFGSGFPWNPNRLILIMNQ